MVELGRAVIITFGGVSVNILSNSENLDLNGLGLSISCQLVCFVKGRKFQI